MGNPKVFISHSMGRTHETKPRSARIKECLISALKEHGWDVFHDSIIEPGEPWRLKITNSLREASAGIVLFNENAMKSDWVTAETHVLCFRKFFNTNFRVVPVFLEGLRRKDPYFDKYAPFQLIESQVVDDKDELSPEDLAKKIAEGLESCKFQKPPTGGWVSCMDGLLRNFTEDDLKNAAEKMKIILEGLDLGDQNQQKSCLCRDISEYMHHNDPLDYILMINILSGKLDIYGDEKTLNTFKDYIIAKWVENTVVEIMLNALYNPGKNRILAINTRGKEITDIYVERAKMEISNDGKLRIISVAAANGEGDGVTKKAIRNAINQTIVPCSWEKATPEDIAKKMKNPGNFAICTLPEELAKQNQILAEVCREYKDSKIVFMVPVGDDEKNLECFAHIEGVPLRPPLNLDKINKLIDLKDELT